MMDFRQYWQEIRAIQSKLPEYVWLMSLENTVSRFVGGCLVEVAAEVAAKLLYAKSHRLATKEEVEALLAEKEREKKDAAQENLRRRGIVIVEVK